MSARHSPLFAALLLGAILDVACSDDSAGTPSDGPGASAGAANTTGGTASAAGGGVSAAGGATGGATNATGGAPPEAGGDSNSQGGTSQPPNAGAGGDATAAAGTSSEAGAPGKTFECATSDAGARFATSVVDYQFGSGQSFGQDKFPESVLGPPHGGLCCSGSLDVTSLGDGGWVTLEFRDNVIVDGDGPDFLIFENAFVPSGAPPESVYAELGEISVSQDGQTWFTFPCTATSYPFGDCAGWHATFANVDLNSIDATDPSVAGGDPFDLSELGLGWARYVRIQDRPELDGGAGTFDLDAAAIVHAGCP